ncbi:MAG TPA: hypothetical protein VHZ55_17670 [Bryobacteraceae bacterium]|jgi:hypothetical protein|nr:hypothetical protein [Bryobacteraceae bacterium]
MSFIIRERKKFHYAEGKELLVRNNTHGKPAGDWFAAEVVYSEDSEEKADLRTHHLARDNGNGEEVGRRRSARCHAEMRCVRDSVSASYFSAYDRRRPVLGVPPPEDQCVAGLRPTTFRSRIEQE